MSTPNMRAMFHPRRRAISLMKHVHTRVRRRFTRGHPPNTQAAPVALAQPVGEEAEKREYSENIAPISKPSDAAYEASKQPLALPYAQESRDHQVECDKNVSSATVVDKNVPASTSPDASGAKLPLDAAIVEHQGHAKSTLSQSNDSLGKAPCPSQEGSHHTTHGIKVYGSRVLRTLTVVTRRPRGKGEGQKPTVSGSDTDLSRPLPGDRLLHLEVQPDEKCSATPLPYVEDSQPKLVDARSTEKVATELEDIEELRQENAHYQARIAQLEKRCEAQARDLENSNAFFNTADKSSDLDIIMILQRLNAEIQQSTTYMADCMMGDFEFRDVSMKPPKEQSSAVQRVSEHIGQALAKSLSTSTPEDTSMLLQIAFQAYLASALGQTASSWCFQPDYNTFIDGIYQRLRGEEAQAISGRWRSLARVHTVHTWIAHPESLVRGIITGISDIMLAAGCTASPSNITSKVESKFGEKIVLLIGLAGRLNKMFNEVISSDFEVFSVRPGVKFEGKNMEDADDDQSEGPSPVLCATHLGLMKQVPVGTLWEKGKKQKTMVLKAKVLLESFLTTAE